MRKAMVLAAGLGTRLLPLTNILPKPLVPIAGQPLLVYHLKQLATLGIQEVMLNLHHLFAPIQEALGTGERWGLKLHYSVEQPDILGTGGGLAQVADFFADEPEFFFLNGDILHNIDLQAALQAHKTSKAVATLLLRPHPEDGKTGWIGVDKEGWVKRVPDMPEHPEAPSESKPNPLQKYMFTGLHILTPAIFSHLKKGTPSCILRTGYRGLLETGQRVLAHQVGQSLWCDIGTPLSYLQANQEMLRNPLSVVPSQGETSFAKRTDLALEAPYFFGENLQIGEGTKIGPNVAIESGAHIGSGCTLRDAIVWKDAKIPDAVELCNGVAYGEHWLQIEAKKP